MTAGWISNNCNICGEDTMQNNDESVDGTLMVTMMSFRKYSGLSVGAYS